MDTMLSPETLEWLRQTARQGQSYSLAHLDHVEQLDALRESLETALKRIAALECRFVHGAPLFTGPLPAGATWTEKEGGEVFTARPAPCSATEAGEPADDEPQTLHSIALKMVDTLASLGVIPEIRSTLRRAILEPMEPATAAAAPVATDAKLRRIWNETFGIPEAFRAIYDHGRAHGTPPPVVEALREAEAVLTKIVRDVWGRSNWLGRQAFAPLTAIRDALQQLGQPTTAAAPEPINPEAEAQSAKIAAELYGPPELATAATAPVADVEACLVDQIRRHAPMAIGTAEAILYVVAAWLDRRGQHGCSLWLREQCAISQEGQVND
jgi:hypothetical protein